MKRILYLIGFFWIGTLLLFSQELNARVKVDYTQVQSSNNQVFKTLEKELIKYINTTRWTSINYKIQERIDCNFIIVINSKKVNNQYDATLQVQSRRPVYNSDYYSPILSLQDKDFNFKYTQFQPLAFNEQRFTGNLVDVITYYVYIILGYDADTFKKEGGMPYFEKANKIVKNAQYQGYKGWNSTELTKNRYRLIDNLLSEKYKQFRDIMYSYHRLGLDQMSSDQRKAKTLIANNLESLKTYRGQTAFAYVLDIFLSTKQDEISKVLSGGEAINKNMNGIKNLLIQLMPSLSDKWNKIK